MLPTTILSAPYEQWQAFADGRSDGGCATLNPPTLLQPSADVAFEELDEPITGSKVNALLCPI